MLSLSIILQIVHPNVSWGLTGGPSQPEFSSFTPIGTSDMVDLSSGDVNYNIPLLDVGGYPINIAYSGGAGMDQEASWVGLGWDLSIGQINRNVRGIPDDFDGDQILYENYMKPNVTAGVSFQVNPAVAGIDFLDLDIGSAAMYNNYTGFSISPSIGIGIDLGNNASVGFNIKSGEDGLTVSPNVSIHAQSKTKSNRSNLLGANVGVSWNSRNGVSQMTMGVTNKTKFNNSYRNFRNGDKRINGSQSLGSSVSFAEQLYTPSRRVGMETGSFTVNAAAGGEVFGAEVQGQVTGYGTVMIVKPSERHKSVSAYGYTKTENADDYGVLDFNREKDGNFSVSTNNLPVTNYTYDLYSVQGQGVGGMFRPYRNQVGYVHDARVDDGSQSGTAGFEIGGGNSVHGGIDIETTSNSSYSGKWQVNNYAYPSLEEKDNMTKANYERVHYKNVGDLSSDRDLSLFGSLGYYDPIRIPYNGGEFNRYAEDKLRQKNSGTTSESSLLGGRKQRTYRQLRNQAIFTLTRKEVNEGIGYGPVAYGGRGWVEYDSGSGVVPIGADHHTAEIQIIRNDGARYVYGLPAYNIEKKEATFSVNNNGNNVTGLVNYSTSDLTPIVVAGVREWTNLPNDQYFNRITTPAYVHTHMLTSVLSTDYSDKSGDGPTPDDYGSYTKFTYSAYKDLNGGSEQFYRWRVPYQGNKATYNEGLKTDSKDDQGSYQYGKKEMYYVNTIETKTHVAQFHLSKREDAKGVAGEHGGIDITQNSFKLDSIQLFSIGEYYDASGQVNSNATPIKVVHFEYSYSLCSGVENNSAKVQAYNNDPDDNVLSNYGGKLTLKKIYFTYRNSVMGKYTGYTFNYDEFVGGVDEYSASGLTINDLNFPGNGGTGVNPKYHIKGYDSWGNYKPPVTNDGNLQAPTNSEFHYTEQDRTIQDVRAQAWCLKKINLPSGGRISLSYESDSYNYVQDKQKQRMFIVAGAGTSSNGSGNVSTVGADNLYDLSWSNTANNYLYARIDDKVGSQPLVPADYLSGMKDDLIQFRFYVNTTDLGSIGINDENAHFDYISGYFQLANNWESTASTFNDGTYRYISIPVELVTKQDSGTPDRNPISKATWNFSRKYLSKYSYGTQPNTSSDQIEDIVNQMINTSMFSNLLEIFRGPNGVLETKGVGRRFMRQRSWVRLKDPSNEKLGGGYRISKVTMSDVWDEMTSEIGSGLNYQTMNYGQEYIYTVTGEKTEEGTSEPAITSGVATYEPIGNKENPFVQPVYSTINKVLAPDEENYMEEPFGESFFPSPQVTYARVTVRSLAGGTNGTNDVKQLHKTGKVVTEFYTSFDYPTIVDQTSLQSDEDRADALDNLLSINVRKHMTMSQGYVIHLNDMNGKQKSQRVYGEGQEAPISGVDYIYDNYNSDPLFSSQGDPVPNKGRLNNNVTVIHSDGSVGTEMIGVETDIVHDLRENKSKTIIAGTNTNVASFFAAVLPIVIPIPLPDYSQTEDQFRSVSTTKVINTFGILKETIAYDAGAVVYTRNLAWDANTGEVLLTETVDEFNEKYYTMNYPAHWAYKGMAQASNNLGMTGTLEQIAPEQYSGFNFNITTSSEYFLPGDELVLRNAVTGEMYAVWVRSTDPITFFTESGEIFNESGQFDFKIVRSGHRNLQSAGIMNVTLMENPLNAIIANNGYIDVNFLSTNDWADYRIINAGAVDYSDDWVLACECGVNTGYSIYNPYRMNEKGVWRTKSSHTYLTGRNHLEDLKNINVSATLTPRMQGFFKSFHPMYEYNNGWIPNVTNWTKAAEVTRYSPYGFELENKDALDRYSAAQYGYNNSFPMAVGANAQYSEIGFDGFEDYGFDGCPYSEHFKFHGDGVLLSNREFHSGKHSIKISGNSRATMKKKLSCDTGGGSGTGGTVDPGIPSGSE